MPVIGLVTVSASQWIMLSIAVMARVAKAYLELDRLLILLLILWDQRAVGVSLSVCWLSGTLASVILENNGGPGVSVGVGGINISIIYYSALISRSCSSPIENGHNGDGFFTTSSRSSIERRAAYVEE